MKRPKKRAEPEVKHEVISVYLPAELKERAELVARRQGHKLSQFIRWIVEREVANEMASRRVVPLRPERSGKLKPGLFED